MKKFILGLMAVVSVTTMANDTKVGIGVGVGGSSKLYKKEDDEAVPVPMMDVEYKRLYMKGFSIGVNLYENDFLKASVFVDPMTGYSAKGSDMQSGYKNIDERKYQAMGGARIDVDPKVAGVKGYGLVKGGKHGAVGKAGIYRPIVLANSRLYLVPSLDITGYSKDFTDYYFGVSREESARSPFDSLRGEYKPDGGYSVAAKLTADYMVTERFGVSAFGAVEKFSDEITNSPIVQNDAVVMVGTGARYYF